MYVEILFILIILGSYGFPGGSIEIRGGIVHVVSWDKFSHVLIRIFNRRDTRTHTSMKTNPLLE